MKLFWLFKTIALSTIISLVFSDQAKADLTICNQSPSTAYVAIGYQTRDAYTRSYVWNASGWATIHSNGCTNVFEGDVQSSTPYLYILDSNGSPWDSTYGDYTVRFCTSLTSFSVRNATGSCTNGMYSVPFQRITSNGYDKRLVLN